jgi:hypothetical protein
MSAPRACSWALLILLLPLASIAHKTVVGGSVTACDVQAWVRAQDLAPGEIIHGDIKIKFAGECDVEAASLGLRFKERSAVKFAYVSIAYDSIFR